MGKTRRTGDLVTDNNLKLSAQVLLLQEIYIHHQIYLSVMTMVSRQENLVIC